MLRNVTMIVAALMVVVAVAGRASAELIVMDTFTATNGTDLDGRTPDTADEPGTTWVRANIGSIQGNRAQSGSDSGIGISIASAGPYTKPTFFQISADLDLNGMTLPGGQNPQGGNGGIPRGITLGFFDSVFLTQPPAAAERREPIGIIYSPDGRLIVIEDVTVVRDQSTILFSTTGSHNLSYWVNTTTGKISRVTFDGSAVAFTNSLSTVSAFTSAETNVAGFYGGDGGGANLIGFADNFTVFVPEPASAGVLMLGLASVCLRRRR